MCAAKINVSKEHWNNTLEVSIGIVDEIDMYFFGIIGNLGLGAFFVVFGVISNAINIMVFVKIGFKETINISLFALAISDILSCLTMVPCIIAVNPFIERVDLPINWLHVSHIVGAWPHVAFTKITTLITAFITVERCLCVFVPLKVKVIITRKRIICYLTTSYLFVGTLLASLGYANQLGWRFSSHRNRTVFGLMFPPEREDIEKVVILIMNAFISVFGFVLITISTIVLVTTLKKKAQWRIEATTVKKTNTSVNNSTTVSTKEHRISKMVVIISTLFIASLTPSVIAIILLWIDKRFDFGGPYQDLYVLMASCNFILETINASLNIVIYYKNSSVYKAMFKQIFCSGHGSKPRV